MSMWTAMRSIDHQNWRRERGGHDLAGRIRRRSETRSWGYYRRQQHRQRRIPAQAGARMRSPCRPASDHPGTRLYTSPSGLLRIVRRFQHRHWRCQTTSRGVRVISMRRRRQRAAPWRWRNWQRILGRPARTAAGLLEGGFGGLSFLSGCWIGSGRRRGMILGNMVGLELRS